MKYFCLQTNNKGCGFACVKMILANAYNNPDYLYLEEDMTHGNYSMNELIKIADNEGVKLEGFEILELNKNTIKTPCIGIIIKDKKRHFIYIYSLIKDVISYYDPSCGDVSMSLTAFSAISENKYLLISKIDKKRSEFKKKNKIEIKFYLLSQYVITFIQCLSIFFLSFTENDWSINLFVSLLIFILSMFLQHYIRIYFLKEFDKKYILPLIDEESSSSEMIVNAFSLKKDYYAHANISLMSSLVLGFSIFVLAVNDIKSLIVFIILLLLKIILNKIFKSKNDLIKSEINMLENSDILSNFKLANDKSYKYLENIQINQTIINLLMILFSFLICFINKNFNQLILIYVLERIAMDKVDEILKIDDKKISFQQNESKYFSYLYSSKK